MKAIGKTSVARGPDRGVAIDVRRGGQHLVGRRHCALQVLPEGLIARGNPVSCGIARERKGVIAPSFFDGGILFEAEILGACARRLSGMHQYAPCVACLR